MGLSVLRLIQNGFFQDSYYLSNAQITSSNGLYTGFFDSYEQLPIRDMIEDSDIIFLEVNEEAIGMMSFGFIDYLLENKILE